ncbi:hypothetical protein IFM89_027499 [Coptis chinensis]|uniref:F-box domain-containing protein n=1 Tax=Coptis chinensis TaxID=261450 RepID=A0A835LXH2_9MAGN|nr:hypothetical protein IFM89_027499 [Coptis chinensis]
MLYFNTLATNVHSFCCTYKKTGLTKNKKLKGLEMRSEKKMQEADFYVLPEGCVTNILSLTSPLDVCVLSLVSSMFKSAADSDVIWEKFLPSNYKEIVSGSVSDLNLNDFKSKKELYFRLCGDPIILEGGTKSFQLEKRNGKKCFMLGAKELGIAWGDTPQHWEWKSQPDSRFAEVAGLVCLCVLKIDGQIDTEMLSPNTTYAAYLVFKVTDKSYGLDNPTTEGSVQFVRGGGSASGYRTVYLDPEFNLAPHRPRRRSSVTQYVGQLPSARGDRWMEIELGEFYNDQGEDGEVKMTLEEVKAGNWRTGLIVEEGCVTNILSFTSPRDACTSSLVSSTFKSAADSDAIWEKFLPSDYKDIVSRSVEDLSTNKFASKKELYFRLCGDPVLLDEGNKSVNLDKKSGKKCFMIGAKELKITWSETPQYWKWIPLPDSRFAEVAELINVCYLHIKVEIDTQILSPTTTYAAYLVIKFSDQASGLEDPPAEVSVKFLGGGGSASGERTVYLDPECNRRPHIQYVPHRLGLIRRRFGHILRPGVSSAIRYEGQFPRERGDGWMEIELGDFYNGQGEDGVVEMCLQEVKAGHWKCGLIVEGIEVRPKGIST